MEVLMNRRQQRTNTTKKKKRVFPLTLDAKKKQELLPFDVVWRPKSSLNALKTDDEC